MACICICVYLVLRHEKFFGKENTTRSLQVHCHQSYPPVQEELESLRGRVRRSPEAVKVGILGFTRGNLKKNNDNSYNSLEIFCWNQQISKKKHQKWWGCLHQSSWNLVIKPMKKYHENMKFLFTSGFELQPNRLVIKHVTRKPLEIPQVELQVDDAWRHLLETWVGWFFSVSGTPPPKKKTADVTHGVI